MKKETRMYYKLPEDMGAIIHMAINYDVKFLDCDGRIIHKVELTGKTEVGEAFNYDFISVFGCFVAKFMNCKKAYIAPESEHIFEPKNKDTGYIDNDIGSKSLRKFLDNFWLMIENIPFAILEKHKKGDEIVFRNNKHFFMPKTEEINKS